MLCHSANAMEHCCTSQQTNDNKVCAALVDGGANGGLLGEDMHILEHFPNGFVNVTGVAGDELANLKLTQATASVKTMADGPIIVIMSQRVNCGHGQTVYFKGQREHFGVIIDIKSQNAGGKQHIITLEGYRIPVHVRDGLMCIDMRIPTATKMDKCPHAFLMTVSPWDPLVLDNKFEEAFCNAVTELPEVKE